MNACFKAQRHLLGTVRVPPPQVGDSVALLTAELSLAEPLLSGSFGVWTVYLLSK